MRNILKLTFIAILGLFVLTGCRTGAVNNVMDRGINLNDNTSDEQMFKAIRVAGLNLGWKVTKIREGLAEAQLDLREHQAIVQIPYTRKSFSIVYKSSTNLNYNVSDNTIHSNYNGWIQNLTKAIDLQLSNLN